MKWRSSFLLSVCLLAAGTTAIDDVRAQEPDAQLVAAAQYLYESAVKAMEEKNYSVACPKLEDVTQLLPKAIGARESLGACYESLGRLASAWSQYKVVVSLANAAGQEARAKQAGTKVDALRPRLASLTIDVPAAATRIEGLTIKLDGNVLVRSLWGTAVPVDAGKHTLEAAARDYQVWQRSVNVVADGIQKSVPVPILLRSGASNLEARSVPQEEPAIASPYPPARGAPWQKTAGFVGLGLGLAGFATSGALSLLALDKKNESNRYGHCDALDYCDEVGLELRRGSVQLGFAATGALVAGAVLGIGGATLLLLAPSSMERTEEKKVGALQWRLAVGPGFIGARGAW